LREQLHDLGTEVATKRQAVAQEVAALDAGLATRRRGFADEIARMEQQTTTAKAPNRGGPNTSGRTFA
jgi:hypothetical protein